MKSNSDVRPIVIQDLGDGSYYYNYNIHEVTVPVEPTEDEAEDTEEKTAYEYDSVLIWGIPNYEKCVKAVLRDRRDETEEFSLINKYNAVVLGLSDDEDDKEEYLAYLSEVLSVKAMVKADLQATNLE